MVMTLVGCGNDLGQGQRNQDPSIQQQNQQGRGQGQQGQGGQGQGQQGQQGRGQGQGQQDQQGKGGQGQGQKGRGQGQDENEQQVEGNNDLDQLDVVIDDSAAEEVESLTKNNLRYVSFESVLDTLNFEVRRRENDVVAGYTDIIYRVEKNSNQAEAEGEAVILPEPVFNHQGLTFISVTSLQALMGDEYDISEAENQLVITTLSEDEFGFPGNEDFSDVLENEEEDEPVLSRSDANDVVRTAYKYRGKPYDFGAKTGNTSEFDCSSLTQYAFGANGIYIPRTSRQQAKQGRYVPVSELKRGDLVFFNWPGRYSSDNIVGHVGIYVGKGYIIHATPNRGVHVLNAAKSSYWRKTYLGAKRISS
ncbi:C40 family peptidase [Caldalkalibacillus salinus]|uniref:C40 family peptidase n=1 Tax=Caldalkalibacillus salinus TaxID=2803787 RepID=UPI0019250C7B|nr:C40 family peptidase [Caldalkalibacillus salinus]